MLVWGDLGYGYTYRDVGCIAFPTDSGWSPGEEIPGTEGMFLSPVVTRDRNGDAWVAWNMKRRPDSYYSHTYVSATTSLPRLVGAGRHRRLEWTLSEPAPESWWTVLRARGAGEFAPVARLRAGAGREMSWSDDSPPAGRPRYKIRRESLDARYVWESEEARWPGMGPRPRIRVTVPMPIASRGRIELSLFALGPVELRLYDLQGRIVLVQQGAAGGTGQDAIVFDLRTASRPISNGVYFASVRDASGESSDVVKVLVLR